MERPSFQPWRVVVPFIRDGVPGGPPDCVGEDDAHAGVRAVVCGATPVGNYKKLWVWPREVVERISRDDTCLYMTKRATDRRASLARRTWSSFAAAFSAAATTPGLSVKSGFTDTDDETRREHLWFEIDRVEEDSAEEFSTAFL